MARHAAALVGHIAPHMDKKNGDVKRLFGLTLAQENAPEPQQKNKKMHL
jgi:hypothetical protein